ncbi:hypothetical protein [Nitrosophilus alvini]|uniref:hypothetical protein n=1 Tax=Nitrosophilus alvini TaxID=2714855 RepID=UPI0019092782|nr:hypothetical protein [Nitrosophilus alvini]
MKKTLVYMVVIIFFIIAALYGLLFTGAGNSMLKPVIESKINENLPQKIKLEVFSLTPSQFEIKAVLGPSSYIEAKGSYAILDKSIDAVYDVKIKKLENLEPLIKTKLRGPFSTEGTVKGNEKKMVIKGKSDVADSDTSYSVTLSEFQPSNVEAAVKNAEIAKLLYMGVLPPFLKGKLNATVKLENLDPENLDGEIHAKVDKGTVDTALMKKDFNITLPKTEFKIYADAKLDKNIVNTDAKFVSNLAKINAKGDVDTKNLGIDIEYIVDIKELALLKPVTGADIRGAFYMKGNAKGDRKLLEITGSSNVANSKTLYSAVLKEFKPLSAKVSINGAKLEKLLYMLNRPKYAKADIDAKAMLTNLDPKKLEGNIELFVKNGITNPKVLKNEFNLTNANISFKAVQKAVIEKSIANATLKIASSVANMEVKKALFDLNSMKFGSDFKVDIPDLDKLYFATKQHLRGKLTIIGDIKKEKDLIVNAHSDTLGGTVDMKLVNDEVMKKLKGIKVTALTDMLMYPRVFDSTMDADLEYNLKTKKGVLNAKLLDGRILPNQMTFLLQQMAKFDITKEIYKETRVTSKINDKIIISDLDMQSRLTHITSKGAILDMKKNRVDAKLRIDIKDKPVYVKIKGDVNKPKVSVDARALLKKEVEKKLQKELEKKVPKEFQEPLKEILKMF